MAQGGGMPGAGNRTSFGVAAPGKLTKRACHSIVRVRIQSARVLFESGKRDELNGIWLEVVASL